MSAIKLKQLRESFFKTVFTLLGHIANCDGYVNRDEIKRTQSFMEKMKLTPECKREAIGLFRLGSSPRFDMTELLEEFAAAAEQSPAIIEVLLVYLISLARIDGLLVDKEIKIVRGVAAGLHYSNIIFDHLLKMVAAQDKFFDSSEEKSSHSGQAHSAKQERQGGREQYAKQNNQQQKNQQQSGNKEHYNSSVKAAGADLTSAYAALGVASDIDDIALKKAYRKLVSQFHPDKLQGQGLPPELINTATDRFKKIQSAYDFIKSHRV